MPLAHESCVAAPCEGLGSKSMNQEEWHEYELRKAKQADECAAARTEN